MGTSERSIYLTRRHSTVNRALLTVSTPEKHNGTACSNFIACSSWRKQSFICNDSPGMTWEGLRSGNNGKTESEVDKHQIFNRFIANCDTVLNLAT